MGNSLQTRLGIFKLRINSLKLRIDVYPSSLMIYDIIHLTDHVVWHIDLMQEGNTSPFLETQNITTEFTSISGM